MTITDLTHVISQDMPVYPGTEPPVIVDGCTIEKDGFAEKTLTMFTHTGTHMDAPAHVLKGKKTLDQLSAAFFVGKAVMLDCTEVNGEIDIARLQEIEVDLFAADYLILKTGWCKYWGSDAYYDHFPVLSLDAAAYLAGLELRGIGIDTISVDPVSAADLPVHRILLEKNMVIIENLNLPDELPSEFTLSCLPMKLKGADGSPIRAVAMTY